MDNEVEKEKNTFKNILKKIDKEKEIYVKTKTRLDYYGHMISVGDDYIEFIRSNGNVVYLEIGEIGCLEITSKEERKGFFS